MGYRINEQWAKEELMNGCEAAEKLLDEPKQIKKILVQLEQELEEIPLTDNALSNVPALMSLIKDYTDKKYTQISKENVIKILSALSYLANPSDIIPDSVPFVGHIDDALVVAACMKQVGEEVQAYLQR